MKEKSGDALLEGLKAEVQVILRSRCDSHRVLQAGELRQASHDDVVHGGDLLPKRKTQGFYQMMRKKANTQYFYWCKVISTFLLRLFTPALLQFAMLFGFFLMRIDLQVQQPDDVVPVPTGPLVVLQNDQPAVSLNLVRNRTILARKWGFGFTPNVPRCIPFVSQSLSRHSTPRRAKKRWRHQDTNLGSEEQELKLVIFFCDNLQSYSSKGIKLARK